MKSNRLIKFEYLEEFLKMYLEIVILFMERIVLLIENINRYKFRVMKFVEKR